MRLLDCNTFEVIDVPDSSIPPFAVLSHTKDGVASKPERWATDRKLQKRLPIYESVIRACDEARKRGSDHLWVDSLCIDTSSSADLEEAVNGSYRRLRKASVCLAFLVDLPVAGQPFDEEVWRRCKYWTRAWTLQELIIPSEVEFFDSQWNHRCSKTTPETSSLLSRITGIPRSVLLDGETLFNVSIAVRMSWSASRASSREEDLAYSLASIAGVTMPVRYGEGGERAFIRLQEEFLHDTRDGSIFGWRSAAKHAIRGILAHSPSEFRHFALTIGSPWQGPWMFHGKIRFSNRGIQVQSQIIRQGSRLLLEIGRLKHDGGQGARIGIYLQEWNGIYVRVDAEFGAKISGAGHRMKVDVARDVNRQFLPDMDILMSASTKHAQNALCEVANDPSASTSLSDPISQQSLSANDVQGNEGNVLDKSQRKPEQILELLMGRSSHNGSCGSASLTSAGTKRSRSGLPADSVKEYRSQTHQHSLESLYTTEEISSHTGSESDDCGSSSSDSESDESSTDDDSNFPGKDDHFNANMLEIDHEFGNIRPGLAQFCFDKIRSVIASLRYIKPPDDRLPPRKRAMTSKWRSRSPCLEGNEQSDPELVVVSRADGYLHLACLFYAFDPEKYRQCLLHDLTSIEDVIRHLRSCHMEPPYCPRCKRAFDQARDRDDHARARVCDFKKSESVEGIDEQQKASLRKLDSVSLGEQRRWLRLWKTIFPHQRLNRSPYLVESVEQELSMVHDCWSSHGKRYISEYLKTRGQSCERQWDSQGALTSLSKLILVDLLNKILETHRPGQRDDKDVQPIGTGFE